MNFANHHKQIEQMMLTGIQMVTKATVRIVPAISKTLEGRVALNAP